MPHETPLISLLVAGLGLAFVMGWIAARLRLSPILGYLVAGVIVGPFTPGFVADAKLAAEVAEVGVILLMFGVGLHFSPRELLSVRAVAAPAALIQILVVTGIGAIIGVMLGWTVAGGVVFGLALSVASTVVSLRALQERREMQTEKGRLTVGWLVIEDFAMVLAMILLPTWATLRGEIDAGGAVTALDFQDAASAIALTFGKVILFVLIMLVAGRRFVPWLLHQVVHSGSRELFRLAVLAIALGVAYAAAAIFDISLALGALFAGLVMAESELSQQAANETLPLRDAFAVLFFVSVGMLFDPMILLRNPGPLIATVVVIVIVRTVLGYALLRLLAQPRNAALSITASRSQIGEFSFIIAGLGASLGLLPEAGRDLVLGGAIISICLTPAVTWLADRLSTAPSEPTASPGPVANAVPRPARAVLVGHGRVGSVIAAALEADGAEFAVIEDKEELAVQLNGRGVFAVAGNAASADRMRTAGVERADLLFVTVPDGFEAGRIVEAAREINPAITIFARAHSAAESEHLRALGADLIVSGEKEIADAMIAASMALISRKHPPTA